MFSGSIWGYSSAWLERTPDKGEVAGSSPASPTFHIVSEVAVAAKFVVVVRRSLAAIISGMLVAVLIRLRGKGGVPPQSGGWRELRDDEMDDGRIDSTSIDN